MAREWKKRITQQWQRFRRWQLTPAPAPTVNPLKRHVCLHCHEKFVGNYCPRCGQPADTQRLTSKMAFSGTLDVWGLGGRSFPRAMLHLLARPGYMIGDYLRGHRQPYFPIFKMLFLLTAASLLLSSLMPGNDDASTTPQVTTEREDATPAAKAKTTGEQAKLYINEAFNTVEKILDSSKPMALLFSQLFFTVGAFGCFRRSPRMGRLTFVEHFYGQTLMAVQLQLYSILWILCTLDEHLKEDYALPYWLIFAVAVVDYKQLHGFSWWSTVLRSAGAGIIVVALLLFLILLVLLLSVAAAFVITKF